jgi:hypothetical protein
MSGITSFPSPLVTTVSSEGIDDFSSLKGLRIYERALLVAVLRVVERRRLVWRFEASAVFLVGLVLAGVAFLVGLVLAGGPSTRCSSAAAARRRL